MDNTINPVVVPSSPVSSNDDLHDDDFPKDTGFRVPCTTPTCLESLIKLTDRVANYERKAGRVAKERAALRANISSWKERAARLESQVARMQLDLCRKDSLMANINSAKVDNETHIRVLSSQLAQSDARASMLDATVRDEQAKVPKLRLENDLLTDKVEAVARQVRSESCDVKDKGRAMPPSKRPSARRRRKEVIRGSRQ